MAKINKISFSGESSTNLLSQVKAGQQQAIEPTNGQAQTQTSANIIAPQSQAVSMQAEPKANKEAIYLTSAVALASLGVTTVLAAKNGKLNQKLAQLRFGMKEKDEAISAITKKLEEYSGKVKDEINELTQRIELKSKEASDELTKTKEGLDKQIKDLGRWEDGQIAGASNDLRNEINSKSIAPVRIGNADEILTDSVNINGRDLRLATVQYGYGVHTKEIEDSLRAESTKRIFNLVDRSKIKPKDEITVRVVTSEYEDFTNFGGMSKVPKDLVKNLIAIANSKQKVRMVVDTPMYLGQTSGKAFYSIKRAEDGTFEYIRKNGNKTNVTKLELLDTREIPIYTDGKKYEKVEYYLARDMVADVDLKLLKPWLKGSLEQELQAAIKAKKPFEITKGALNITYDPNVNGGKPSAFVKYDALLQKNDKFRMDGPIFDGDAKTIYNNVTHQCKETERFMYFNKFFYEQLASNSETARERLGADVILANDWQSGGISAMTRLLTTVRKHFGGVDPEFADKLYNTPIITVIHNAQYSGGSWENADKYLNILFGEHAAMIAKNAWMPKGAGLPNEQLNGLFHNTNINPQTMAAVYSDALVPVSEGYAKELAAHSGFGRENHNIFRMRARAHEFGLDKIKHIAQENGIDEKLVTKENLAYQPITNGCDRINHTLTEKKAYEFEKGHNLPRGSIKLLKNSRSAQEIYNWHMHNKSVYLKKLSEYVDTARKGGQNPLNIHMADMTNLEGVTNKTMVITTAGRIVDQKGLDIFAAAVEKFMSKHAKDTDPPVIYVQGTGNMDFIKNFLEVKRKIAAKYGSKAADRIVYAETFEQNYYNGCRIMSDFNIMSSWFEPCGLVHKENAAFNASIGIVNEVGGLTSGLRNNTNALFVDFVPKFDNYEMALDLNSTALAAKMEEACEIFKDQNRFAKMLKSSYGTDHSWLKINGAIEKYAKLLVDLKVMKPEVLEHS